MGTRPTKAASNIYCRSRLEAAKMNDRLNSRAGAAELLGVSESSLADYELGNTKVVPVDKVNLMADLYKAPEIRNYYCANECPIGKNCVAQLEIEELDRLTIKILATFQKVGYIRETLIDITADGVISESEKDDFRTVIEALDAISKNAQELKLWAEKQTSKEKSL